MSKLLFICGFPSSGTELTKTILNAHPDIHISDEMPWLKDIERHGYDHKSTFSSIQDICSFQKLLTKLDLWHVIENLSHDFTLDLKVKGMLSLEDVLRTCCHDCEAKVWGNKTPQNTENIADLLKLFPNALFLIVIRDIRDVCLSWRNKWSKDMIWCAAKWAERMAKGKQATDNLSRNRYLYLKYEDMLSNPEEMCMRICRFLDLSFSNRMLAHHKHTRKMIDGKINYGQPIKAVNFGKWRKELQAGTVERIEEIASKTMRMFGYKVEYATSQCPISLLETWRGRFQDSWAMLTVGNRYKKQSGLRQRLYEIYRHLYWRFLQ